MHTALLTSQHQPEGERDTQREGEVESKYLMKGQQAAAC